MKVFVLGSPGSGKTTVSRYIREFYHLNVVDVDDEILRINNGVWPDIDTKNKILLPRVIESVCALAEVVLLNSYMSVEQTVRLRNAGFSVVLLRVSAEELRRRHEIRSAQEGWSNSKWLDWHQSSIQAIQDNNLVDRSVSGERDVASVAAEIVGFPTDRVDRG